MLDLLDSDPSGLEALAVYLCGLSWSGGNGTDGLVPRSALRMIHGTQHHAELLVAANLWEPVPTERGGWIIRNFDLRQQVEVATQNIRASQREGARKANCRRWHGERCGCWKQLQAVN